MPVKNKSIFTKNFTMLVLGQVSSLFGNFILRFALSMYILELTGSAAIFASLLAIATIPTIFLSPLGGVLADRANRRNIMVGLDLLSGITVLITVIFLSENNAIGIIGAVMVVLSILGAFESPTVQACVPQMHEGNNLIKANAIVNQVQAISSLIAPLISGVLYVAFGIKRILIVTVICFFLTALLECFIKLDYTKRNSNESISSMIKSDLVISLRFIFKEQKDVLKILLMAAAVNFLLTGIITVGLPFFIRNILALSANYYAVAESLIGLAAIIGSIMVGLLVCKIQVNKLFWALVITGLAIILTSIGFIMPVSSFVKFIIIVASVFIIQLAATIFSVFMLSIIQQKTPNELLGKIMAYVVTIAICAQPLGQIVYGVLFDKFVSSLSLILALTGIATCVLGFSVRSVFQRIDK